MNGLVSYGSDDDESSANESTNEQQFKVKVPTFEVDNTADADSDLSSEDDTDESDSTEHKEKSEKTRTAQQMLEDYVSTEQSNEAKPQRLLPSASHLLSSKEDLPGASNGL